MSSKRCAKVLNIPENALERQWTIQAGYWINICRQ